MKLHYAHLVFIPCYCTAAGELKVTLALDRLLHSRAAQDADNKFFRGLKLNFIKTGKLNIDELAA
jgi:hypothetical protein